MRQLLPGRLVLATHNPGKVVELADLLNPHGLDVVSAGELGLPEPDETETSFIGNARLNFIKTVRCYCAVTFFADHQR